MKNEDLSRVVPTRMEPAPVPSDDVESQWHRVVRRVACKRPPAITTDTISRAAMTGWG